MATQNNGYVRLPEDGAGKRVRHRTVQDIELNSEAVIPDQGDTITGAITGATGVFVGRDTRDGIIYYIRLVISDTNVFQAGENLLLGGAGGTVIGQIVDPGFPLYAASIHIADPEVPEYTQRVDKRGAALATFPEGTPQFDSFGRMQVSQQISVGEYYSVNEDQPGKYWNDTAGTGSITWEGNQSMVAYQTGTENGAKAYRTTNQYHPYKPATSQLVYIACAVGDQGKANVVREWGYFDDLNGFGFRLNGTQLEVFLRTDTSGSVQETVIPQDSWNLQKLNNSISSDFVLDVSKANIYWMDMQWLGAGRVRFGVITPEGIRLTVHEIKNANVKDGTYMRNPTLPLRWGQKNTGIAASVSQFRVSCSTVSTESSDVLYTGTLIHTSPPAPVTITNSTDYQPFLAFRPKLTVDGYPNRIIGFHETFDWYSEGDALHIGIFVMPPGYLSDAVWSDQIVPSTMLEVDRSGTIVIPSTVTPIESFIIAGNQSDRINLGDRIEKSFGLPADGVTQGEFIFAAKVLKAAGTGKLFYTKYWKEVR